MMDDESGVQTDGRGDDVAAGDEVRATQSSAEVCGVSRTTDLVRGVVIHRGTMRTPRVDKVRAMTVVLLVCAATVWTWGAGIFLAIALFAAADSRCNGQPARVDMDGGWLVIATVCTWAVPFVIVAVRRTSLVSVIVAMSAVGLGVVILVHTFWTPGTFCY